MNWFVRYCLTFNWANAITLVPFGIYIKEGHFNNYTTNEERIHEAQEKEMLIIFYPIWYFIEWLIKLILPPWGAYRKVGFDLGHNPRKSAPGAFVLIIQVLGK